MENVRISVWLDGETARRLREAAVAAGKSESEILREALAAYFAGPQEQNALAVVKRAGIAGCAKGLLSDLSTNKEYFEGFGR